MDISYEKKYYELEKDQWWCTTRRELIVGFIQPYPKSSRIFEIGCAGGYLLQALQEKGFRDVSGIDVSNEAISLCRAKGLDVRLGDGKNAGFSGQSFDVIVASDVLEHIRDDETAIRSWSHMLKPGGVLICFVPAFQFLWSGHDVVNQHQRRYGAKQLISLAEGAGFRVDRASFWNFFLFFPTAVVRGLERIARRGAVQPKDQFYAFGGGFLNTLLICLLRFENKLILWGMRFPVGVSFFVVAKKP